MADADLITDPIFVAIAEYRVALAHLEGLTGSDSWGAIFWKADGAEEDAWRKLLDTPPVTDAGRKAIRDFANDMHPSFMDGMTELLAA